MERKKSQRDVASQTLPVSEQSALPQCHALGRHSWSHSVTDVEWMLNVALSGFLLPFATLGELPGLHIHTARKRRAPWTHSCTPGKVGQMPSDGW